MYDRRAKNVAVFEDSMGLMNGNKMLRQAIRTSIEKQKLYLEGENVSVPEDRSVCAQFCFINESGRRRNTRKLCAGGMSVQMQYVISLPEY